MSGSQFEPAALSDEELQDLVDSVVADYARRVEAYVESGESTLTPFPLDGKATATDVIIVARQMLAAFGLSPFELSLLSRY